MIGRLRWYLPRSASAPANFDTKDWRRQGHPPLHVSINASPLMVGQGVVKAQGYFYARPLEAAAMDAQALLGHVVPESQARH